MELQIPGLLMFTGQHINGKPVYQAVNPDKVLGKSEPTAMVSIEVKKDHLTEDPPLKKPEKS